MYIYQVRAMIDIISIYWHIDDHLLSLYTDDHFLRFAFSTIASASHVIFTLKLLIINLFVYFFAFKFISIRIFSRLPPIWISNSCSHKLISCGRVIACNIASIRLMAFTRIKCIHLFVLDAYIYMCSTDGVHVYGGACVCVCARTCIHPCIGMCVCVYSFYDGLSVGLLLLLLLLPLHTHAHGYGHSIYTIIIL